MFESAFNRIFTINITHAKSFCQPFTKKSYYLTFRNDSIDAKINVDIKARFRVSGLVLLTFN